MFALDTFTLATITNINKRTENHGSDKVHAIDLSLMYELDNKVLDLFPGGLRALFYTHPGSKPLPGVEDITNELRSGAEKLEGPHKIRYQGTGYMLTLRHGEVSGEQLELGGIDIDHFKMDPKQGGSCFLWHRAQIVGLDGETMGKIMVLDGRQVSVLLAPPTAQTGTLPDTPPKGKKGKKAAEDTSTSPFKFTTDEKGGGVKDRTPKEGQDKPDPTTAFVASHSGEAPKPH